MSQWTIWKTAFLIALSESIPEIITGVIFLIFFIIIIQIAAKKIKRQLEKNNHKDEQ